MARIVCGQQSSRTEKQVPAIALETVNCYRRRIRNEVAIGVKLRDESAGEDILATKVEWTDAVDVRIAEAHAGLKRVLTLLDCSEVAQLPAPVGVNRMAHLRAAANE